MTNDAPATKTLSESIEAHIAARDPAKARARLESVARGFVPNAGMEDALRQRTAMGAPAYDAEMRRMGTAPLELSLYARGRAAAIATGAWSPPTPEGDPKP